MGEAKFVKISHSYLFALQFVGLTAPGREGGTGEHGFPPLWHHPCARLQPKYGRALLKHQDPLRHGAAGQHSPHRLHGIEA